MARKLNGGWNFPGLRRRKKTEKLEVGVIKAIELVDIELSKLREKEARDEREEESNKL